ncbi:hypothetical protein BT67DRAFT_205159 [Trichocladium antarcticum]|uniref:Uncharacterized protein n=1 Tax=Trichocladium antarcticum TaxID=1450529 RepID=A0AAN6ZAB2_9PEZI|nr:hypothetical protein BT67DRAFT_205159 [Trichocladium antarcticum]
MRQEIVPHEEAHEDPVVDGSLKIPFEINAGNVELNRKILTQDRHMEPDEGLEGLGVVFLVMLARLFFYVTSAVPLFVALLAANPAHPRLAVLEEDIFTENAEVGFVGGKAQHDQIGVQAIDDMTGVGVMLGRVALRADEVHNLVFALAGDGGIRNDDLHLGPRRVRVELVGAPVAQTGGEDLHERSAGGDGVGVKGLLDDDLDRLLLHGTVLVLLEHLEQLLFILLFFGRLLRGAESAGPLLVHLGSRRDTIYHALVSETKTVNSWQGKYGCGHGDVPTAIISSFRGRTMLTTRSVYLKTSIIISSSSLGAGLSSG